MDEGFMKKTVSCHILLQIISEFVFGVWGNYLKILTFVVIILRSSVHFVDRKKRDIGGCDKKYKIVKNITR